MLLLACTTMCAACRPTWHARDVLIFAGDRKQQEQSYMKVHTATASKTIPWSGKQICL